MNFECTCHHHLQRAEDQGFRSGDLAMAPTLSARVFNQRVKTSLAALRETGAKRIAIEIAPNGSTLLYEMSDDENEHEARRLGRLIEGKLGG